MCQQKTFENDMCYSTAWNICCFLPLDVILPNGIQVLHLNKIVTKYKYAKEFRKVSTNW